MEKKFEKEEKCLRANILFQCHPQAKSKYELYEELNTDLKTNYAK